MTIPANKRIRIRIGGVQLEAELTTTKTAEEIYKALPIEDQLNVWGEEFYFKISGVKDHRETATTQVKVGDVAFWGAGQVLAIFFGRTPMSLGPDPVRETPSPRHRPPAALRRTDDAGRGSAGGITTPGV